MKCKLCGNDYIPDGDMLGMICDECKELNEKRIRRYPESKYKLRM